MQTPAKRVLTYRRCQDANPMAEKPVKLKQIKKKGEENTGLTITEDDPCNQNETIRSSSPKGSHRQFQVLVIISCLISIVALLLVVLMLSGKIGNECGCSAKEATKSLETHSAKIRALEENLTRFSMDSVENFESSLSQVMSTLDKTNRDLKDVKKYVPKVENFESSLSQVTSTLDKTNRDLKDLKNAVPKLENINYSLNQEKSRLDRTNSDLAELSSSVTKLTCFTKRSNFSNPCKNGGTWYPANEECKFKCFCAVSFIGELCEKRKPAESCKVLYDWNLSDGNKAYPLKLGSVTLPVYCHMASLGACGDGGWTLVMKMNGSKDTFHYDSKIWSDMTEYNTSAGMTGFDGRETMLPTYWNTSFSKICLGMKNGEQINFIVIKKTATSLYSLIADGNFRPTSLGRNKWKMLLGANASLQRNCNKEGFNPACTAFSDKPRARIGILGNENYDCVTCDSRIGFGTGGHPDESNTCGNVAAYSADNGDKYIKTMGYIFVQ